MENDIEELDKADKLDDETIDDVRPFLMGQVAAVVTEKKLAKAIVDEIVSEAVVQLGMTSKLIAKL